MQRLPLRVIATLFCIVVLGGAVSAREKRKARTRDIPAVALPDTYDIDLRLGLDAHGVKMMGSVPLAETESTETARDVFQHLSRNYPTLPFPWKLTFVNTDVINASSTAGGQVYAYAGIVTLAGSSKGL